MSNAAVMKRDESHLTIAEWRLPVSRAVIRLAVRKAPESLDCPFLEMDREVYLSLVTEELSSDGPLVASDEDKIYFTRTVLPQAEEQTGTYYIGRSNLPEWGRLMKKWRRG